MALSVSVLSACGGGGSGGDGDDSSVIDSTPPVTSAANPALDLINKDPDSPFDGTGVRVAVYDTGINAAHDEFSALNLSQFSGSFYSFTTFSDSSELERNLAETPNDDWDEDYSDTNPNQGSAGHGTAVASAIAGNPRGVSPGSQLYVFDIYNAEIKDSSGNVIGADPIAVRPDSIAALLHTAEYANLLSLNFANYSLTGVATVIVDPSFSKEPIWDDIAATEVGAIAGAGNTGYSFADIFVNTTTVPECTENEFDNATGYDYDRCLALRYDRGTKFPTSLISAYREVLITVGAVNSNLELARYSNFPGDSCELQERWVVAPGTITAADYDDNSSIVRVSGTSVATPLVTGAAAAVSEATSLANRAVLRLLLSTADQSFDGYNAEEHGQGMLDLEAALAADPNDYIASGTTRAICP